MSFWSRLTNVFRGDPLNRHIDEASSSAFHSRTGSSDIGIALWFDSLSADAVFGWRQIRKRKATSAAAILSLALAIGSCTAAFRLIDALFLRPMPVSHS